MAAVLEHAPRLGVDATCEAFGVARATYYRRRAPSQESRPRRPAPARKLPPAERKAVLDLLHEPRFVDLAPAAVHATLLSEGRYVCSVSTMHRILAENSEAKERRALASHPQYERPELMATGPNQLWSWDITYLRGPVRGQFYYLYLVMDIWSRKIVGWAVHERESAELAAALIREAALREGIDAETLVLHSDNGGPMKGATMLVTLQWLGIVPSLSRPQVPDDNPYSEALFRTVKYRPQYPSAAFESVQAAREWVVGFVQWYNHEHRHSAIRFVTPAQRHSGQEQQILVERKEVYEEAKRRNPNRWSGQTRCWAPAGEVVLNASADRRKSPAERRESA